MSYIKQIKDCPTCKEKVGWFEKRVESYLQYFDPDGEPSHAAESDYCGRGGKRKFCNNCNRDITDCVG